MAAAAKKTASSYYQWSDDEKRRYYTEFESVPRNSRRPWLKSNWDGASSQFYRNRTAFLKAHPDFELGATSLEGAVRAKKRIQTMRKQKNALPRERQLAQAHAREVLAAKRAAIPKTNRAARMAPAVKLQTIPAPVPASDDTQAYLDEYLSLRGNGRKAVWLAERGLTHKVMYEVRHRGRSLYSVAKFKPKLSQSLVPAHNFHAQILPAPPRDIPSLDDAITAMEVERDQLSAFIERLKRFRNVR